MRLLICAGGTGGGVYPALSVLQAVGNQAEAVLWVGGEGGMEADLVARLDIPYQSIPAAGVHGVGLSALPGNVIKLIAGVIKSRRILLDFKPDALLFTGGYVAVPMAVAGTGIKSLLYVPDIEPGLALKALAKFSDVIALTAAESVKFFNPKKRTIVTGYPTRTDFGSWNKESARKTLGLRSRLPVLLVIGGSKGARSINHAVLLHLPELLDIAEVIHVTGTLDWEDIQVEIREMHLVNSENYHAYPYLHDEIGAAFACADLVISRAGASTLGELPLFGLPAILVPYPHAWRYQKVNADYLAQHNAALVVENAAFADSLLLEVKRLFSDAALLAQMRQNMKSLAALDAAHKIANLLIELGESSRPGKGS